ncbi:MAG: hypothetical protein L6Q92_13365 [Phycisphaerae bacterium]|nr:hypothetical protein [Phycisphaerae bacterium]
MQIRTRTAARLLRTIPAVALAAVLVGGCSYFKRDSKPAADKSAAAPTVYINPMKNGAAAAPTGLASEQRREEHAQLSFVVQASAHAPDAGSPQERKLAMSQAAMVEALAAGVIESRQREGQPIADFQAQLSPQLSMRVRTTGDGRRDIELRLKRSGRSAVFHVIGGVLQHPPYDLDSVRRVFDETRGRFALLSTEESIDGRECFASVACYGPAPQAAAAMPIPPGGADAPTSR